ncbi:chain length determination protein [Rodentibacter mrazii]|uniref:Chain length determination protein n=1 Tax=Rodentibacter mrazii TaxID=1908257 RepID=A0A1V3IEG7_9PAST|nr:Wzz/FepE/Etk N-terminal domain-containing protein [Rodentibacter mrazii]OOF38459.1 chain length determination protein [Rodentibacter mrazii]
MNSTNVANNNDEIDLIELIKVLWNKKIWILLSALVCTLIAGVYAFTAKEQWTSKAEVIAPKITDLGTYFNIRKEYSRILGSEFDANALTGSLFSKFNLLSESLDERRKLFGQSNLYKSLTEGKDEQFARAILADLVTKITIVKPDPKKEPDLLGRRISFSAETATNAQDTLQQFISFTNQSAYQLELDNFVINLGEIISDLNYEKIKFERDLTIQRKVQLENLTNALNIAKEAGIKEYSKSFGSANNEAALQAISMSETKVPLSDSKLSDGTYLFMLGEKYLQAQINVITQKSVVYPPRYYQVSELLKELKPLLTKAKESKASAFSYQASPDYPVMKDKPKKTLILVIGFVFGLVLSILSIIISYLFKQNK